jgi:adenosylmethionine-8-amino-7-oxononanoate aminotransferase
VRDVRVLGAIGVVQLTGEVEVAAATAAAAEREVWLRPFRDLIYTMPPYLIGDADLATICVAMQAAAGVPPIPAQAAATAQPAVPAGEGLT